VNLPAGLVVALYVHAYLHSAWRARRLRSRAEAAVVANAAD